MITTYLRRCAPLAAAALLVGACTGSSTPPPAATPPSTVNVDIKEFSVTVDSAKAAKGNVTFTVHNQGTVTHEFVVFKSDLAADKLPLTSDGKVDEEASEVTHFDPEVEDLSPGSTGSTTINLAPGHYVLICNLPGHYAGGMHASLDVSS